MANEDIIIQVLLITLGMIALGEILNRILGLDRNTARELREKSQAVQERMKVAQTSRDMEEMYRAQQESMQLYKELMKKQMIPSCVRCLVFFGIFAVLNFVYADYVTGLLPYPVLIFGDGWFAIYFLFSIVFQLVIYGFKRLYRKLTGKEDQRKASREISGMLAPQRQGLGSQFQLTRQPQIPPTDDPPKSQPTDSWKDRIKK
jgi:hypothetical protein